MSATWKWLLANIVKFTVTTLVFSFCYKSVDAQRPALIDYSTLSSRPSPDWVRDGVIYEIFPRVFSPQGDFNGVTARLDQLKDLGVNILWLMPIHPVGRLKAKGTIGSPYAVKDYFAINPDYGTAADLKRLVSEAHKRRKPYLVGQRHDENARLLYSRCRREDNPASSGLGGCCGFKL